MNSLGEGAEYVRFPQVVILQSHVCMDKDQEKGYKQENRVF